MKTIKLLFTSVLAILFFACEGPPGPPGFDGFDGRDGRDGLNGLDGVNITSTVLEIQGTFSPANNYSLFYEFPQNVEVFESDLVLVYLLWESIEDTNGGAPIDVWRLMPQTRIIDQGLLQYNYDHTFLDVSVFLEADFNLDNLPAGDTDNQVFRIAIVPGEFGQDPNIDITSLSSVMSALDKNDIDYNDTVVD